MKFIQIATGAYTIGEQRQMNHAVYALSEKGNVFKYERNKGWIQLKNKKTLPKAKPSSQQSLVNDDDIPF